jgi:hypothetical protein
LKLQANHVIAQSIVEAHHHSLIGLEELSGIRERTRRRKRRRVGKRFLPLTPRQRRANRRAPCVAIETRRTVRKRDCSSSVSTSNVLTGWNMADRTHFMPIWLPQETLRCERSVSGRTGYRRGSYHLPQDHMLVRMYRMMRPKLHVSLAWRGMQNCGGVQIQTLCESIGVTDKQDALHKLMKAVNNLPPLTDGLQVGVGSCRSRLMFNVTRELARLYA